MILYHDYAAIGRDCDFLRGQNAGISELDAFAYATARRARVLGLEVQSRVRDTEQIARKHLVELPSTRKWDIEARRVTRLVSWILSELRAVHMSRGYIFDSFSLKARHPL